MTAAKVDEEPTEELGGDAGTPILELHGLRVGYGSQPVLHGIDLAITEGERAVVLGLNGAGKTTLMLTIAGVLRPWAGEIHLAGEPVTDLSAPDRVARGVALVPEGRRVFPGLTVERNLELGAWGRKADRSEIDESLEEIYGLFPRLAERRSQAGGTLSGGEQQMLALGRGLMSRPRVLLVDEASLGLAPVLVQEVFELVEEIAERGVTVFLVEQNVSILRVVDRAFIMQNGSLVYEGAGAELRESDDIRKAYLG